MGNLGGAEILVILLVALIVLGPTKLPPAVRQVGKVVGEIRRIGQGFQQELQEAAKPLAETTETIRAADPRKVMAPPPAVRDKAKGPALNKGRETGGSGEDGAAAGPVSWGTAAAGLSPPPAPGDVSEADGSDPGVSAADEPAAEISEAAGEDPESGPTTPRD